MSSIMFIINTTIKFISSEFKFKILIWNITSMIYD